MSTLNINLTHYAFVNWIYLHKRLKLGIDVKISDTFNCVENLQTVLMIPDIAGPSCRGIYHRGFGATLSENLYNTQVTAPLHSPLTVSP